MTVSRRAVVLFNLGGPDSPAAVQPFLYNLFSDRAILSLPLVPRLALAWMISRLRARTARDIYARIGGRSPILEETRRQAEALELRLHDKEPSVRSRVFVAMRYWHPRAREVVREVRDWRPDEVVLLPLYPQYSTTTTQSSLLEWMAEAQRAGLQARHRTVCCWPEEAHFLRAHAEGIEACLRRLHAAGETPERAVLLFSAHGLPKSVIRRGDPYQAQVEKTCAGVMAELRPPPGWDGLDWRICYQSRVGPMAWIGPSLDEALERVGAEGRGAIIVPIAFVSEHSETLVELDVEYRAVAAQRGLAFYRRIAALGTGPGFIEALAALALQAGREEAPLCAQERDTAPGRPACAILSLPPFAGEASRRG